ncbi:unnamed protein product [Dracunculus medinensis]|uniref:EF-hand domain-containing protein n=1 Tax=Dracunculus medinensis TaxID=318479 RepID=A0A0N4U7U2_DRAME|nr:unnamed protein product [Dracunculus medinensis]
MDDMKEIFTLFDTVGDMKISINEVGTCLRVLGHAPTEEQVKILIKPWEDKKENRISAEEFIPIVNKIISLEKICKRFSVSEYIEAFSQAERDRNGFIHSTQLKFLLMHIGERLSREEVEKTILGIENADGKIDIERYVNRICDSQVEFSEKLL